MPKIFTCKNTRALQDWIAKWLMDNRRAPETMMLFDDHLSRELAMARQLYKALLRTKTKSSVAAQLVAKQIAANINNN